jgi:CO/xanthine dehydrogenase Mo-binding subunit
LRHPGHWDRHLHGFAEIVSDRTGIPLDKIDVVLGDSSLPPGPTSGGSSATASVVPAIAQATDKAIQAVLKAAPKAGNSPFAKADPKSLKFGQGVSMLARNRRKPAFVSKRFSRPINLPGSMDRQKQMKPKSRRNSRSILSAHTFARSASTQKSFAYT